MANLSNDELKNLLLRRRKILLAREDLISFAEYMSPVPDQADNMKVSLYRAARHHRVLAAALEKVEKHEFLRLHVSMPPRHGKTRLANHLFTAWYVGRNPEKSVIVSTYSEKFSWDHGRAVRALIESSLFKQIFPKVALKAGAASVDRLETTAGGVIFFVGRKSGVTGRGADVILFDDPIKDRQEADSPTIRDQLWRFWTQVLRPRLMTKRGAVILIQTRWHEDDLAGRILDPHNHSYNEREAKRWRVIEFPAIAQKNDVLKRKEGEALWPERFDRDYLDTLRQTDVRGFQALYQGKPTPEDGVFFRATQFRPYMRVQDMPYKDNLRFYAASDHAVSLQQGRDKTCLMVVGVDLHDQIWIQPDLFWRQADTALVVEAMVALIERYHPLFWWAEKGHISQSIGPFLRKRMLEKRTHVTLDELTPVADKQTRAQSIHARMSMLKVCFPTFTGWWAEASDEMLKFPHGTHDDFVDTLSLIGLGLFKQRAFSVAPKPKEAAKFGTYNWVIESSRNEKREREQDKKVGGW